MPPKTLPEKSDVIVNTLKYFETLTLIVRVKRQENQLSLIYVTFSEIFGLVEVRR